MKSDVFDGIEPNLAKRSELLSSAPAKRNVVIIFTPRSGSSWLTDLLAQTKKFGRANEIFNPNFMPRIAQKLEANDLDSYSAAARRKFSRGGVFSFEITPHQMNAVFESQRAFHLRFGSSQFVWLIRRDIIAQAVSLTKMVNGKISHAPLISSADITEADRKLVYSHSEIRKWLLHIRSAEIQAEAYFKRFGVRPLRIAYEDMMTDGALRTVERILPIANASLDSDFFPVERHTKVGTARNEDFALRFRKESWLLMRRLDFARRSMLRRHKQQSTRQ